MDYSTAWMRSPASILAYAHKAPTLTACQEQFWVRQLPEPTAVEVLMAANLRHVVSLVRKYRGYQLCEEDLLQSGIEGLLRGLHRLDPTYENRAVTFVSQHIKERISQHVQRHLRPYASADTKPTRALFFYLRRRRSELLRHEQRWLNSEQIAQIAREKNVSQEQVRQVERYFFVMPASMDERYEDDGDGKAGSLHDIIADDTKDVAFHLERESETAQAVAIVEQAMAKLTQKKRWVIAQRKLTDKPPVLGELASALAVSKARVGQIENEAMQSIADFVEAHHAV